MTKVRWGLLSTANINRALIPAIRASNRGELVAVASRSRASAEAYAARWDIPQTFGSYEAMLASDEIDAIYNPLPNHLHAAWSIAALEQGKHVLCEKPFALTLAEVDDMAAAAARAGRILAEAFMYRHHPQTKLLGEWVRAGRLGTVKYLRGTFNFTLKNPDNVRLVPEWGGGCLWDVGVYPLSMAQFLLGGPPQWVFGDQRLGQSGVDLDFAGQMHYAGGEMVHISSSFQQAWHTEVEVIGTTGRVRLTRPFVAMDAARRFIYTPADGQPEEVPVPEKELYLGEVEDMHAAILDGQPNYLSLAESRNHVKTILALYESARSGQKIALA